MDKMYYEDCFEEITFDKIIEYDESVLLDLNCLIT